MLLIKKWVEGGALRCLVTVGLLFLAVAYPSALKAQPDAAKQAYNQGKALEKVGRVSEALPYYRLALELGEKKFGPKHPTMATILFNTAILHDEKGRLKIAEPLYKRSLAIREDVLGPDHGDVVKVLNHLVFMYKNQQRYNAAEPLYQRLIAIHEKALGPNHREVTFNRNQLAELYQNQGRFDEAETLYIQSLAIKEKTLKAGDPAIALNLRLLAVLYGAQGKYIKAEPLHKRALAINEKAFGPNDPKVAGDLNNLAELYRNQGKYKISKPLYQRSLKILEKAFGPENLDVALVTNNLALLYFSQGNYGESEPFLLRSLAIFEKKLGPVHRKIAASLNNLAGLYKALGRYNRVEPLLKRSLKIKEKLLSSDHPDIATSLNNLALYYKEQGNYATAERFIKRSLAIFEKAFGPDHEKVALGLNNLAEIYSSQGRSIAAEPLYKRALTIFEKALGPHHPDVAASLSNLALNYYSQRRYAEAEPLYKRSLAIQGKVLGPGHPKVALGLANLAALYLAQGRLVTAELLNGHALEITEKVFGKDHPQVAARMNGLAVSLLSQNKYSAAEPLLSGALKINKNTMGSNHPNVALNYFNLAKLYAANGNPLKALEFIRPASAIHRRRLGQGDNQRVDSGLSEQKKYSFVFLNHISISWAAGRHQPAQQSTLKAGAFEAAQLARATNTAAAVAGMGARFAAKDDALASLVRERQDAARAWQQGDRNLIEAASRTPIERDTEAEATLRDYLSRLDQKLEHLDKRLKVEFPQYAELTSPQPVKLSTIQKLLGPKEAMLAYVVGKEDTFLWVVRPEKSTMHRLELGAEKLKTLVRDLRTGLDLTGIASVADIPAFDTKLAHELYTRIFAPAQPLLEGVKHIFVVADGALQSLPMGVLVSEKPTDTVIKFTDYRKIPWLTKTYALSTLPSVSALRALRVLAKKARAKQPFLGIGDPLLEGHPGKNRGPKLASLFTSRGIADVNAVRSQLAPLPDTADELAAMAKSLGADANSLMLRENATESALRKIDLTPYKVLAFATHGLVAGDLKGLSESALVLTPPKIGSAEDDGLLTASEVAQLKLDADWVILSACNTAAADGTPGAEGLSGLTKAFFYAGTRALLVSHWPVSSDAAVRLTTTMLSQTAKDPTLGRAEALQRSMLALMNDETAPPHYAHPMFWAPFVVVGEGG